jgi:ABC-type uncharacterized transport system substrate-binding protein
LRAVELWSGSELGTGVQLSQSVDLSAERGSIPKRLELYKEALPALSRIAPDNQATAQRSINRVQAASQRLGLAVQPIEVLGPHGFEKAFSQIPRDGKTGVVTVYDATFFNEREQMARIAVEHGVPVMATADVYVKAGILMSYGPNVVDLYRRAGGYVDKILKGTKPSDLPVEEPIKSGHRLRASGSQTWEGPTSLRRSVFVRLCLPLGRRHLQRLKLRLPTIPLFW